jgi:hypothetical protein
LRPVQRVQYANHQIHDDLQRLADSWQHWAASGEPLNLGPTLLVKTDCPVDIGDVARKVIDALEAQQTID